MSDPTPAQMNCGHALYGPPADCTCGTCEVVEDSSGCIWCDIGFTPTTGKHETAKGSFACTYQSKK